MKKKKELFLKLLILVFLKNNLNEEKINLIIFSFFPFFIKKFENFNKGNSKLRFFNEILFLKQTGTSIILFIKNFINEEFLIYKKSVKKDKSFWFKFTPINDIFFKSS